MTKQKKIIEMFNKTAKTYDILNMILSFGIDKIWRKNACDKTYNLLETNKQITIADIACGSGDMSICWDKRAFLNDIDIKQITGIDPSVKMLEVAKQKAKNIDFIKGEAKKLPFDDKSIDILSITYGIRNVVDRKEAFLEFKRVLKNNGLLVILEFTNNKTTNIWDILKNFYMKKVIPIIGAIISRDKEAYKYLPESIENFLTSPMLVSELKDINLDVIYLKNSLNISSCFIAKNNSDI